MVVGHNNEYKLCLPPSNFAISRAQSITKAHLGSIGHGCTKYELGTEEPGRTRKYTGRAVMATFV